ncbi:MAG: hypothetical protein AAF802_21870 [Planctomycetota bacterium]
MTEISIRTAVGRIHIIQHNSNIESSLDVGASYDFTHEIPTRVPQSTSVHRGVRSYALGSEMASCLVILPGETPLAHSNALVRDRILYLASGFTLCALDERELSLLWSLDLPSGFKNGFYFPPLERTVIALGCTDAVCVNFDGSIRWSINLPSAPTGHVAIGEDSINIECGCGKRMSADFQTGTNLGITKA